MANNADVIGNVADDNNSDDNSDDNENVSLWDREESPLLTLRISNCLELTLLQYPSDDDRWGIHSSVWDGGIATLAYLQQQQQEQPSNGRNNHAVVPDYDNVHQQVLVLELGSGTGIVGLGLAQLAPSWLHRVFLTDLAQAMPLLEENIKLNHHHNETLVQAAVLHWDHENDFLTNELEQHLTTAAHVLLMGADIIYRPILFQPLLQTIQRIRNLVLSSSSNSSCRVLLGSHSIRSYHGEFWKQAREMGFHVQYKASVRVELSTTPSASTSENGTSSRFVCCPSSIDITIPSDETMMVEDAPVHPQLTTIFELG